MVPPPLFELPREAADVETVLFGKVVVVLVEGHAGYLVVLVT